MTFSIPITNIVSRLPRYGNSPQQPIGSINKIIVHWDAVWRPTYYSSLRRYISEANGHIYRDWELKRPGITKGSGLMYHFKIDNVGEIFLCRPLNDLLWHAGPANYGSIAICMDGTQGQVPTASQAAALKRLLYELSYKHPEFPAGRSNVKGHKEVMATACPGDNFGMPLVRQFRGF